MRIGAVLLLAVPAMLACDGATDTGEYSGTPAIRIAGSWTYSFYVTDGGDAYCTTYGSVLINQTQNGDQFAGGISGVYNCTEGSQSDGDMQALVAVTSGELSGLSVRFIAFGCVHLGALADSTAKSLSGSLSCTFPITANGPTRPFSGSWSASR